jgi:hypothetical protein
MLASHYDITGMAEPAGQGGRTPLPGPSPFRFWSINYPYLKQEWQVMTIHKKKSLLHIFRPSVIPGYCDRTKKQAKNMLKSFTPLSES